MVDPAQYVADYAPEMPGQVVKRLGLAQETPRLVYTIANIPSGHPEKMTLNLAGPIVINAENRRAVQVILEDLAYPTRHQVFADAQAA
jgi:flagellar assembly factor FliW